MYSFCSRSLLGNFITEIVCVWRYEKRLKRSVKTTSEPINKTRVFRFKTVKIYHQYIFINHLSFILLKC